jgi:hypothetical protein
MGYIVRIADIFTMKDILDYNEIIIFPRFKERFGNIMIGLVQLIILIFFFFSGPGKICINYTYDILTSSMLYLQILAALIFFIFGFFFSAMASYFILSEQSPQLSKILSKLMLSELAKILVFI